MCSVIVALVVLWVPACALADGDPASDVLVTEPLFLPWDAGISTGQQARLTALLQAAAHSGYHLRVALIASPSDLGSVTELWRKPPSYAEFLGEELSLVYRGTLLVVMPDGFGLYRSSGSTIAERASLASLRAPGSGTRLGAAAIAAIESVAGASGHRLAVARAIPTPATSASGTKSRFAGDASVDRVCPRLRTDRFDMDREPARTAATPARPTEPPHRVSGASSMVHIRSASRLRFAAAALSAIIVCGCGVGQVRLAQRSSAIDASVQRPNFAAALASSRRVGPGPHFRPRPWSRVVRFGLPVDGLRCRSRQALDDLAHVELFAANHVVVVPAGIGVTPPARLRAGRIVGERCSYPLRTLEPTGLLLMGAPRHYTVGELFDLWGEPLTASVMAGFRAGKRDHVAVFIDGAPWTGSPREAPLSPRSQVTIEVGPYVPPHSRYMFPMLSSFGA